MPSFDDSGMGKPIRRCPVCTRIFPLSYFNGEDALCTICVMDTKHCVFWLEEFYHTKTQILKEVNTHGNNNADKPC